MTMEAVATLRNELARLEEQRRAYDLEDLQAKIRADRIAIEDIQHEIAAQAGQEGLPIPIFDVSLSTTTSMAAITSAATIVTLSDFEKSVHDAISTTEGEMVALDSKLAFASELAQQVQQQQEELDRLLASKKALAEQSERIQAHDPLQQFERTREQQAALSNALQSLQDSLRQRVKALGVSFGQASISGAEAAVRKQLETLQIALGERVELHNRHTTYLSTLKDGQEILSERYNRLAKFSGTLGSWIVPPNPFSETLNALCMRCRQELDEANESEIVKELDTMQAQNPLLERKLNSAVRKSRMPRSVWQPCLLSIVVHRHGVIASQRS